MYKALRTRGIERSNIITAYSDGGKKGLDSQNSTLKLLTETFGEYHEYMDTPASFEGDSVSDIQYSSSPGDISKAFDVLAKKLKSGDHLVMFITDHGSKYNGILLWNGHHYNVSDLNKQLKKLPKGVTTHIVTSMCYGGQLTQLTSENVCVMASTDKNHTNTSIRDYGSRFIIKFADKLMDKKESTLLEAYSYGRDTDIPLNNTHTNSLKYFLNSNASIITQRRKNDSDLMSCLISNDLSPRDKLIIELDGVVQKVNELNDSRRVVYQKYLDEHIKELKDDLNSWRIINAQKIIKKLQKQIDNVKAKYDSLSSEKKHELRPEYTELARKLRIKTIHQRKLVQNVKDDYKSSLNELNFIKYTSQKKFDEYVAIKECLEYEI